MFWSLSPLSSLKSFCLRMVEQYKDTPKYTFTQTLFVQSPYPSAKQEIRFKLPSRELESATQVSPFAQRDDTLIYGPFTSLPAYAPSEVVTIHFPSIAHFITFDRYALPLSLIA